MKIHFKQAGSTVKLLSQKMVLLFPVACITLHFMLSCTFCILPLITHHSSPKVCVCKKLKFIFRTKHAN